MHSGSNFCRYCGKRVPRTHQFSHIEKAHIFNHSYTSAKISRLRQRTALRKQYFLKHRDEFYTSQSVLAKS